jgi:hypothetical protein
MRFLVIGGLLQIQAGAESFAGPAQNQYALLRVV